MMQPSLIPMKLLTALPNIFSVELSCTYVHKMFIVTILNRDVDYVGSVVMMCILITENEKIKWAGSALKG